MCLKIVQCGYNIMQVKKRPLSSPFQPLLSISVNGNLRCILIGAPIRTFCHAKLNFEEIFTELGKQIQETNVGTSRNYAHFNSHRSNLLYHLPFVILHLNLALFKMS